MQQPAAGAGTRTTQPSTGQLRDRIDMQQAARGTGMKRSRVNQQPAAGGQGTEVAEMIVDDGQQRGRIDMQPLSTGTRAETWADERSTNLALGDHLGSTGQRQGNIDMQQAAGGTGVKRQRVQQPVAEGSQDLEPGPRTVEAPVAQPSAVPILVPRVNYRAPKRKKERPRGAARLTKRPDSSSQRSAKPGNK